MKVVPPWESLCSAAVCRGRWEECKAWMREQETSPAPHPTTGTHIPHYTLIACSWPHERRKHPAKHTNTLLIAYQESETPCWFIIVWKTHQTHYRSDIRPAPLHIWQRTIADHTGHVVHEAISTFRENQRMRVRCFWVNTQNLYVYLYDHFQDLSMIFPGVTCSWTNILVGMGNHSYKPGVPKSFW